MKEPKRIPLTDSPRNKEPQKLPLTTPNHYDIEMIDDIYQKYEMSSDSIIRTKKNEDNQQDNSESIQ
jgi:hypothetical protein